MSQNRPIQLAPINDSTGLLGAPLALRARFEEEGYLYLKNLLPKSKAQALQAEIFQVCKRNGWFADSDSSVETAVPQVVPVVEGEAGYFSVYDDIQRLEALHSLPHDPAILQVMRVLLDESAFPHPLSICRLMFPHNTEATTPPHQDFPNNQGTAELYACWIPLSDCPVELGGLAFMPGSHKQGLLPLEFSLGAGNRQAVLPEELLQKPWVTGSYEQGDVLIFHSLMLHRSLENKTDQMRLSVDYRYQSVRHPLTENCLQPHFQRLSWDEIYSGWLSKELQHYWQKLPLTFAPWTNQYHELPEEHLQAALGQVIRYNKRRSKLAEELNSNDPS
jgi:ectoine hydroxylase-related dioxygenase (phytanoyl-CoA dioxygenase family)